MARSGSGGGGNKVSSSQVKVHRCRFAEWMPSGIVTIEASPTGAKLAVARENGNIEIWNTEDGWFCERVIQGPSKRIVEALIWQVNGTRERLFSAGMTGMLIEWNLTKLAPKRTTDSCGGGPIHAACLKQGSSSSAEESWACSATLALGCSDGSIRLFDSSDAGAGFVYIKALQRHTAPVLCVSWRGDMLVSSGADGNIRIWDLHSGSLKNRITVDSFGDTPTLVWQAKIVSDNVIASGDSHGRVQFWDAEFGTLIQTFVPLQADVLALSVASDNAVYACGVDPLMTEFNFIRFEDGRPGNWVVTALHRSHSHDVNSIAIVPSLSTSPSKYTIVSGGRDSQLCFFSSESKQAIPQKLLPFNSCTPVSIATTTSGPGRFLLRNRATLQLFQIGTLIDDAAAAGKEAANNAMLPVSSYHHLLDIKTHAGEHGLELCCSALSLDLQWAVCSDPVALKLYRFRESKSKSLTIRTKPIPCSLPPSYSACFTKDSKRLIVGCFDSSVRVLDLNTNQELAKFDEFRYIKSYDDDEEDDQAAEDGLIRLLCESGDNKRFAACDHLKRIHVYNLDLLTLECSLPKPKSAPTALAFHPSGDSLVVACASNEFFIFDISTRKISEWSRLNGQSIPKHLLSESDRIFGVIFLPENPDLMFLLSCAFICKVDLTQPPKKDSQSTQERPKKAARTSKVLGPADAQEPINFRMIRDFKPLLGAGFVSSNELALVEMPWIKVLNSLPPTYQRRKYGT